MMGSININILFCPTKYAANSIKNNATASGTAKIKFVKNNFLKFQKNIFVNTSFSFVFLLAILFHLLFYTSLCCIQFLCICRYVIFIQIVKLILLKIKYARKKRTKQCICQCSYCSTYKHITA